MSPRNGVWELWAHAVPTPAPSVSSKRLHTQPLPQTLTWQLCRGAAFVGLSPGVAQRGHSSDTREVNFWQRLGGALTHLPGQGAQIQAGPPGETPTDSRAGRLCVLGSRQTGSWKAPGGPLTRRGSPRRWTRRGGTWSPHPSSPGDGVPRGGAADVQYSQPLWENTPMSRPAAGTTALQGCASSVRTCRAHGQHGAGSGPSSAAFTGCDPGQLCLAKEEGWG